MADVYLTAQGKKELEERLEYLVTVRRGEVSEKIRVARGFGDISENAEYDAAKDEQAAVEGEIFEIETKLRTAKIIESSGNSNIVTIGCTVSLEWVGKERKESFQIVGTTESDYSKNKISNESPIGKAVLNKKVGDIVEVVAPKSTYKVKITGIKVGE